MLLKELVRAIKDSSALTNKEKQECLSLIPSLNKDQLQELASNFLWLEEQKQNLDKEEKSIVKGLKTMFIKMNQHAAKQSKKDKFKSLEEASHREDQQELDVLIKDL